MNIFCQLSKGTEEIQYVVVIIVAYFQLPWSDLVTMQTTTDTIEKILINYFPMDTTFKSTGLSTAPCLVLFCYVAPLSRERWILLAPSS